MPTKKQNNNELDVLLSNKIVTRGIFLKLKLSKLDNYCFSIIIFVIYSFIPFSLVSATGPEQYGFSKNF